MIFPRRGGPSSRTSPHFRSRLIRISRDSWVSKLPGIRLFLNLLLLLALLLVFSIGSRAQDVCVLLKGSVVIAQDSSNTFLGKITNSFDSESVFNEFGTYGNDFSSKSIWNQFSTFGNEFNGNSPFNKLSSSPPMIIKGGKIIGYLSANKSIRGSISPNLLKALCKDEL